MVRIEDDCVGCDLPCIGDACPYKNVPHYHCDKCGDDVEELRYFNGEEICYHCWLEEIENDLLDEFHKLDLVEGN